MSKTHDLKIDPKHYLDVFDGLKRAEIRINDRQYKEGDFLRLRCYDRDKKAYMDIAPLVVYVSHVLLFHDGLKSTFAMLSITPLNNHPYSIDYSQYDK